MPTESGTVVLTARVAVCFVLAAIAACKQAERAPESSLPVRMDSTSAVGAAVDSSLLPVFAVGAEVLRPEVATLVDLANRFGGTLWENPADASGDTRLCYLGRVGDTPATVVFGSSAFGGPERALIFVAVDGAARTEDRGVSCPILELPVGARVQGHALTLGQAVAELEAQLGAPSRRTGDSLFFEWSREELGPYEDIGSRKTTTVIFSVFTSAVVVLQEGRVRAFEVSHTTSY